MSRSGYDAVVDVDDEVSSPSSLLRLYCFIGAGRCHPYSGLRELDCHDSKLVLLLAGDARMASKVSLEPTELVMLELLEGRRW